MANRDGFLDLTFRHAFRISEIRIPHSAFKGTPHSRKVCCGGGSFAFSFIASSPDRAQHTL